MVHRLSQKLSKLLVVENFQTAATWNFADCSWVEAMMVIAISTLHKYTTVTKALCIDFTTDIIQVNSYKRDMILLVLFWSQSTSDCCRYSKQQLMGMSIFWCCCPNEDHTPSPQWCMNFTYLAQPHNCSCPNLLLACCIGNIFWTSAFLDICSYP